MPGLSITDTSDATFDRDVLEVEGTTLVDFWAPWHPPSKLQDRALERYAAQHPDVRVLRFNTVDNPMIPGQLGVKSVPTLVVFKDGMALVGIQGIQDIPGIDRLMAEAEARAASIPQA